MWEGGKAPHTEAVADGDRVFYQNGYFFLDCVTLDGEQVMRSLPLPGCAGDQTVLQLFAPSQDTFVLSCQVLEWPEEPPSFQLVGAEYGSPTGEWTWEREGGMSLPPLYCDATKRAFLTSDEVLVFDAETGEELTSFPLPMPAVSNWSAAPGGDLFALGEAEAGSTLVALDTKGEPKWRWNLPEGGSWVRNQPPILGMDGEVCVLAKSGVWCVKEGEQLWHYAAEALKFGCSLADGSFLVTIGSKLVQIGPDGADRFSVDLPEPAATPPTVDSKGRVWVATQSQLLRIEAAPDVAPPPPAPAPEPDAPAPGTPEEAVAPEVAPPPPEPAPAPDVPAPATPEQTVAPEVPPPPPAPAPAPEEPPPPAAAPVRENPCPTCGCPEFKPHFASPNFCSCGHDHIRK